MNRDRILQLADHIEGLEVVTTWKHARRMHLTDNPGEHHETFTMETKAYGCGAPACMLGWANHLAGRHPGAPMEITSDWLGISDWDTLRALYIPELDHAHYAMGPTKHGHITAKQAAWTLRNLAETGEVVWKP